MDKAPEHNLLALSIVVPCFNDEQGLDQLHRRLTEVIAGLGCRYELIMVDDGSADATWKIIRQLSARDPNVRGIKLSKNHGHQIAVTAGLSRAQGDRVLIIDSDLQDPPELLPEMMRLMDAGADNVYGQRLSREGVPWWKKICYKAYYKILTWFAGCPIPQDTGDFRLISRRVVDLVNAMPEGHRFLRGMISWLGFTQQPVFYHREGRFAGKSGYTLSKLFCIALDGILGFSILPLRFAAIFSLLLVGAAVLLFLWIVFGYFINPDLPRGWTSLIAVILLVGALQLFVLGIIGEYLGRLYVEAKRRPLFVISETAGQDSGSKI